MNNHLTRTLSRGQPTQITRIFILPESIHATCVVTLCTEELGTMSKYDLRGATLRGAMLRGVTLRGATLRGAS